MTQQTSRCAITVPRAPFESMQLQQFASCAVVTSVRAGYRQVIDIGGDCNRQRKCKPDALGRLVASALGRHPAGTYSITRWGSSGSRTHSVTVTMKVKLTDVYGARKKDMYISESSTPSNQRGDFECNRRFCINRRVEGYARCRDHRQGSTAQSG